MEMTRVFSLLIPYRDVRSENSPRKRDARRADFLTFFSRFSYEKTMRIADAVAEERVTPFQI